MNITAFVQGQGIKDLITIFNIAAPQDKQVKKFADRKTAEARVIKAMAGNPDYVTFHKSYSAMLKNAGIELPPLAEELTPEQIKARKLLEQDRKRREAIANPTMAKEKRLPAVDGAPKKQNTPPHLNVRCAKCGYYAKTTPAMMKIARLKCPVDHKHGNLLTAEERGEKRGR